MCTIYDCCESKLNLIWWRQKKIFLGFWLKGSSSNISKKKQRRKSLTFHSEKFKFHPFVFFILKVSWSKFAVLLKPTIQLASFIYFSSDYLFKTNESKYFYGVQKVESEEKGRNGKECRRRRRWMQTPFDHNPSTSYAFRLQSKEKGKKTIFKDETSDGLSRLHSFSLRK